MILVVAGLASGLVVHLVEPTLYRAETTIVVQRGGQPASEDAHALAQLVTSNIVLANVDQQLRGIQREHVHVAAQAAGVVRISYDAASPVQATRVAQQIAIDFQDAIRSRFPALQASVFDPAHGTGRTSRHAVRDIVGGVLAGLVLAGVGLWRTRARTLRERGHWRVSALSELVEAHAHEHTDRVDDWRAYIAVLRAQADGDLLPYALDSVVREVFAPVLPRKP